MSDALSTSMFWAGALLALTPIVIGGIAVLAWWHTHKRPGRAAQGSGAAPTAPDREGQGQYGDTHRGTSEREGAPR